MLCLQMQLQTQITLATCPVRYAGALIVDAAAVLYAAWPIMGLPTWTTAWEGDMQRKQWGQGASIPGLATISQCPGQGC